MAILEVTNCGTCRHCKKHNQGKRVYARCHILKKEVDPNTFDPGCKCKNKGPGKPFVFDRKN